MNNYNFGSLLSPIRFEQISRDLLSFQYGIFENFAEGKDGGIDFRYSNTQNKILVVQCKRYKNVDTLLSNLKKESKKIQNLTFDDYLLVVSLDLTHENKNKIIEIFKGRIQNANQIFINSDLNYFLSLHLEIEFKYPELWMNSVNIHQKIFNLGFIKHSEFIKDKLKESLINFVPYNKYYEIIEHLKNNNIVIISGNPGMGKTTLAHSIISSYIYFKDFQLVDLSYRKIQEAESFIYSNEPTIFFIDDFLGKIKLDKDNDFAQLLFYFIQKIESLNNKKLIITSREYIIKKAVNDLFSLEEISLMISKYTIELNSFTRRIRTEILYNHIKNSKLDLIYIHDFLQNNFNKIIDHPNYNPRIIEHLTNYNLIKNSSISAEKYFNFFLENLDNPTFIWEHVYNNLPNDLYKLVLFVKFMIDGPLPIENLEKAIINIIEESDKFKHFSYDDFAFIINEMEGTFFRYETRIDELIDKQYTIIEFINPSIIDYIDSFIWTKTNWLKILINHAFFYEQLFRLKLIEVISKNDILFKSFVEKILFDFNKLENACFGYFDFSVEEKLFECNMESQYKTYLSNFMHFILVEKKKVDLNLEIEVFNFLKKEIFRYQIDKVDDISEKIAFVEIAIELLRRKIINSEDAINHYIPAIFEDVKELVYLEYMLQECDDNSASIIRNNKHLANLADQLFLNEIIDLQNKDYVDLLEFLDDYSQIKTLLPLKETTRQIKKLCKNKFVDESYKKFMSKLDTKVEIKEQRTTEQHKYFDISDETISQLFQNIK